MIELKFTHRDPNESTQHLRDEGRIPAVCYGPDFESTIVSVDEGAFRKAYREVGTSSLIKTTGDIDNEMCLVQDIQTHVVSGEIQHIDFKMVSAGQTTEVIIPIKLVGTSLAVENKLGLLNRNYTEVTIETIPSKIPDHFEIDISELKELGDSIKLADIKTSDDIKILEDLENTVVSIIAPQEEKEEDDGPTLESVLAGDDVSEGEGAEEAADSEAAKEESTEKSE